MASVVTYWAVYAVFALQWVCTNASSSPAITVNDPSFHELLGPSPDVIELTKSPDQLFHEAAVYHAPTQSLWVISDQIPLGNDTIRYTSRITGLESPQTVRVERINNTIPGPIGGFHYIPGTPLGDVILFAAHGTLQQTPPAGIYALNPYPPYNSSLILGSYGDYPFNLPDDLTVTADGTIWLSDPAYGERLSITVPLHISQRGPLYEEADLLVGFLQGDRSKPILPDQVYSFNPFTNDSRVVADGFGRPNGLAASADGKKVYVGDTGASIGNNTLDFQGQ